MHTNFVSHTKYTKDTPVQSFWVSNNLNKHLFGYFFLDSSIRLQGASKEVDLSFPFGPLVGINSQGSVIRAFETQKSTAERKFTQAMGDAFKAQYESSYRENPAQRFISSQSSL